MHLDTTTSAIYHNGFLEDITANASFDDVPVASQRDLAESDNHVSLLWLPYVVMTLVILALLCLSFVRFHRDNKERYQKRGEHARRKDAAKDCLLCHTGNAAAKSTRLKKTPGESVATRTEGSTDVFTYGLCNVDVPQFFYNRRRPLAEDDLDVCSIGTCSSIIQVNEQLRGAGTSSTAANSHILARKNTYDSITEEELEDDEGGADDVIEDLIELPGHRVRRNLSLTDRMDESIVRATLDKQPKTRLKCRQSLTFMKRDSKMSLFDTCSTSTGTSAGSSVYHPSDNQPRWVAARKDRMGVMRNASRNSLFAAQGGTGSNVRESGAGGGAGDTKGGSSVLSFMSSRMRDTGSSSVKLNMWVTSPSRKNKTWSDGRSRAKRGFRM